MRAIFTPIWRDFVGMKIYGGYGYGLRDRDECRNAQQRAINIYQHIPKEEKQYSIIPVHLLSGEDKQCRKV